MNSWLRSGYYKLPRPLQRSASTLWRVLVSRVRPKEQFSGRVERAVEARLALGDDFFGGWEPSDIRLFSRYAHPCEAREGTITDYFGVRTRVELHPGAKHLAGEMLGDVPIPDDCVRAEAIEYFAVLHSLETAGSSYAIAELGASFAPWACFAGVLALRTGRSDVKLVAVEASRLFFDLIPGHLALNGIDASCCDIKLTHGAIASERGVLYFPKATSASDNGGQAVDVPSKTDYVGRKVDFEEVQAYPIEDVLHPGVTDLLHVDVQGAELEVLSSGVELLNRRVRSVFVGTHSRKIEGGLLDLFHGHGWKLLRERPTRFVYQSSLPNVVGWTTRDGGQFWVNPRCS